MAADLTIASLRGGLQEENMPNGLADDQCEVAMNVERFASMVGERRLGCQSYALTGSGLTAVDTIVHLSERMPSDDVTISEYWAIAATVEGLAVVARQLNGTWSPVTPQDALLTEAPQIYHVQSVNLNQKKFFAYASAVDRLHVWDGVNLRPTGVPQPARAPGVGTSGSPGTYTQTRYFRVRDVVKNGDVVLLRSEPSESATLVPPGTDDGAVISRVIVADAGVTHWELEASMDGETFYRIQTLEITTRLTTDTTAATDGYADLGPVSEAIGDYLLQPSAKFLAVDEDRLLLGGHWTDPTRQAQVSWSPVAGDPGVGNDERLPLVSGGNNTLNLDASTGGPLTGISQLSSGTWFAFKWIGIYKMTRTGDILHAYFPVLISTTRGALPESLVRGVDESGRPCLYFLDPAIGPCSIGAAGLRDHLGLRTTWQRVTVTATGIPCRVAYYPDKKQVHWWVAVDGDTTPSLKLVLQTTEIRQVSGGATEGGWTQAEGTIAEITAVGTWHELSSLNGVSKVTSRPFIGQSTPATILRCDVGDTDNADAYTATLRSKPYFLTGILTLWGAMSAAVLAGASTTAQFVMSCLRNFGVEQLDRTVDDLSPEGTELYVVRQLDDLSISEATSIQFQIEDV